MKILFVADVSPVKVIGGAERVLREHVVRLVHRGHQVEVLTRKADEKSPPVENLEGLRIHNLSIRSGISPVFLLSSIWHSFLRFHRIAGRAKLDLINFHQPITALGVLLSPRSWGIPKIYTFHSLAFLEYETRVRPLDSQSYSPIQHLRHRLNSLLRRAVEYLCLKSSSKVIALSEFSRGLLMRYHPMPAAKVIIIPGGVDITRFVPAPDRQSIRRPLRIPDGTVFLFTVRNLVPRMGLEALFVAMKEVSAVRKNVFLVIGGDGVLRGQLERLIDELGLEDNVRFEGFIPEDELPNYFQAADYFILPTRFLEGFGLVTVEALACGTPVLGTPVGAIPEVLAKLDPSLLTKGNRPEDIAELIVAYTSNERLKTLEALRPKCRDLAVRDYDWEKAVDRIESVFRSVL